MNIRFFIYEKQSKIVICALQRMPDNDNFSQERGDVWCDNQKILGRVNWDNCEWISLELEVELDYQLNKYLYIDGEFTLNLNWTDGID